MNYCCWEFAPIFLDAYIGYRNLLLNQTDEVNLFVVSFSPETVYRNEANDIGSLMPLNLHTNLGQALCSSLKHICSMKKSLQKSTADLVELKIEEAVDESIFTGDMPKYSETEKL